MKDDIVNILKNSDKALDVYELLHSLYGDDNSKLEELIKELHELEEDTTIYHTKKDKYMLIEDSHLKKGVLRVNKKGFGFVEVDNLEEDVFIDALNMNGAIHDDVVLVEITSKMNIDRLEGRILKILERKTDQYIGEINFKDDIGYITLDDNKINLEIIIHKENSLNSVDGHKVVVELDKKINNNKYEGKVVKIIGHKHDPGIDILSIIYKYKFDIEFPVEVQEEVSKMPMEVLPKDREGRKDLTNEIIFTIDGDDTRDIDDAISIEKMNNGHYKLGVHIADVSYYVKEDSPLDKEAYNRGTSVYLVDRVIPMLPHELSNGICSLNPGVERLAVSCVMEFDGVGKQLDYEIFPSIIKSRKQMTYKKVNDILERDIVADDYKEYEKDLRLMNELAHILRKMKEKRGYVDFGVNEAKILVDDEGKPVDVQLRYQGEGEKLIEDFMIAANECVANHIYFMNLPFIYRVHEVPKPEKLKDFLKFVSSLGYNVTADLKDTKPTVIQDILKQLEGKPEYKILSSLLLRCMQKAVYRAENLGHYALGSSCYTHFTSPIRRYPDTTVHRLLHCYLFDHNIDNNIIRKWESKLIPIADQTSERERASVNCEREVDDMKMAEYMESHIGEEFDGMISSITNFGMFVELDNLIEGLVPIKDLKGYYHFDEEHMCLIEEKSHKKYTIGESVRVKVVRSSKEDRTIDFEIVKEYKDE